MAPKPIPRELAFEALAALNEYGTAAAAAGALGIPRTTLQGRVSLAKLYQAERPMQMAPLPSKERSVTEILAARKQEFSRYDVAEEARRMIGVKVNIDGPIAINFHGDPHLDNPGCDIAAIERDCDIVRRTDGMFAGSIGDMQDSWVGRLAKLYAHSTITAKESWKLVKWYIDLVGTDNWLFIIHGNHDLWAGDNDLLGWIASHADVVNEAHQVRFSLNFKNKRQIRIAARHDFPGHSMWNPTHGGLRAARFTYHDHILVSGHRHSGGYQRTYVEASDIISHVIQLGAYKIHDDYRNEKGFNRMQIGPSTTVIIDPNAKDQKSLIHVYDDTEHAAFILKCMRRRKAA